MTNRLNEDSRDILKYRPNIHYVEPEVEKGEVSPVEEPPQIEDVNSLRNQVKNLAKSVNILASTLQARADEKAKGVRITLDPKVDIAPIQSMRRLYPEAPANEITYQQYKQCKERMRSAGEELGQRLTIKPQDIKDARDNVTDSKGFTKLGGWDTPEANNGQLRPEVNKTAQIIEPLDIDKFQDTVLKIIMNSLWNRWIRPALAFAKKKKDKDIPTKVVSVEYNMSNAIDAFTRDLSQQDQETSDIQKEEGSIKDTTGNQVSSTEKSDLLTIADCQNIQKAFEKGAAYSATPESVFVTMTPLLNNMRIQSATFIAQADSAELTTAPSNLQEKGSIDNNLPFLSNDKNKNLNLENMNEADEDSESILNKILPGSEGLTEGTGRTIDANILGGAFNSECIPCGVRINMLGEMNVKAFSEFTGNYYKHWQTWLEKQRQQIFDLLPIFNGTDQYIDLCALIEFLKDFMCVPDLQRIISVLMALLSRISFDIGGVIDLVMSLIAPLLQPFLSGLVDTLAKYILLIVKPIECIINAIQENIRKLDYNLLFQNISSLDKHVSLGPTTNRQSDPRGPIKVPYLGIQIDRADVSKTKKRELDLKFNLLGPIGDAVKKDNLEKQRAVEKAQQELEAIQNSRVDGNSPTEVERYQQQLSRAKDNYRSALQDRDLSELGRINTGLSNTVENLKSSMFTLVGFLKEAAQAIEGFFFSAFDELKKMMGQFLGGGGSMIELMIQKTAIIQMISLISSIIKASVGGPQCNEDDDIKIEKYIHQPQGMQIWTDDQGNIHIQEDQKEINKAIMTVVESIGPNESPSQKLKSLIEFTGDETLDTEIAKTTDALVTAVNVTFKCPLQTSVDQTEQVNQWIKELDND